MSRTQQKLQAMSAQELLIQEKKRMIEEKLRLNNAKKDNPTERKQIVHIPYLTNSSYKFILATQQSSSNNT